VPVAAVGLAREPGFHVVELENGRRLRSQP
jgi:hypothetical protein